MCIALISTAHPSYELIIIDNRDEYLHRPTAPADWWQEPNSHVLGSRDLARPEQGTWMGVTKQGRVAVLTNYRESAPIGKVSRGAIVNGFLTEPPSTSASASISTSTSASAPSSSSRPETKQRTTSEFVQDMIESQMAKNAGGFSLVCGKIGEPLAIISNRMSDNIDSITWVAGTRGETIGLSNTFLKDRTWPKIVNGEILMKTAIDAHVTAYVGEKPLEGIKEEESKLRQKEIEDNLIARLFKVLSTDTLPRLSNTEPIKEEYMTQLKESIFIPLLGDRAKYEAEAEHRANLGLAGYSSGMYGTQKQTILLVDHHGRVKYVERTLYDDHVNPIPLRDRDRVFEFVIEKN